MEIREAQGHLFELAFNAGILTAIHQTGMKYAHMGLFIDDLKKLNHRGVVNSLVQMKLKEGFIDAESQRIWSTWGKLLLLRGHLGGLGLWHELMDAIGYSSNTSRYWELLYVQCCLSDATSMRTLEKNEHDRYSQILSQLGITPDRVFPYINKYATTGEFLKADTLMLMSKEGEGGGKKEYRIVCVDLSAFTVDSNDSSELNEGENQGATDEREHCDLWNLSSALSILESLGVELHRLMSKSVYHHLKIDTKEGSNRELIIGRDIKDYLTAFSYYDKDFVKLVQAASYSASFVKFLESENRIPKDATVQVTAIGYTTQGISTLNVGREDFDILDRCADAYKSMKRQEKSDTENSINSYKRTLVKMLNLIKRSVADSLLYAPGGMGVSVGNSTAGECEQESDRQEQKVKEFVDSLCDMNTTADRTVSFTEIINSFHNPSDFLDDSITSKYNLPQKITLRNAHAQIIKEQLSSACRYLFLTGNPGIGKTTTVVDFLRDRVDEGFLLFYVSPRLSVNEDTINKFRTESGRLFADDLYCIYTSHAIIAANNGLPTVKYYSNADTNTSNWSGVTFIGVGDEGKHLTRAKQEISRLSGNSLGYDKKSGTGVIRSLCDAGHALINKGVSKIVITCSTQSLRKVNKYGDSLDNFHRLFRSVTNQGEVISEEMIKLSSRLRNIIVMVDEVTGDSAGVEWFHAMQKWLDKKLELFDKSHGFNTKLIVADASLIGVEVVKPHLGTREAEPAKIYCSPVENEREPLELSFQSFTDESARRGIIDSTIINANSYPARLIELTYKVFFETCKINEDGSLKNKLGQSARDDSLVTEIIHHVSEQNSDQLLVYIQDKQRLIQLIDLVKKRWPRFDKNKAYLEIHSLSDPDKESRLECKDQVRVVFMTSSASRGISFPHAKHIIVELPRFQIENNLMEIIQTIYRGRGDFAEGKNNDREPKKVTVYIVEKVFTNVPSKQQSQITRVANLIGSLLVLRTAIMTRITGAGYLCGRSTAMIPIGGKGMYSGGETFSTRIKSLMQRLRSHQRLHPEDRDVKLALEHLPCFFESAKFFLQKSTCSPNSSVSYEQTRKKISLPSLLESGVDFLFDQCSCMADLLDIELSPQVFYVDGSLLLVPMNNNTVTSLYRFDPYSQVSKYATPEFINALENIWRKNYPQDIKNEIYFALDFIQKLKQNEEITQQLSDSSNFSDQYFAVPLHFLVADETLRRSFTEESENSPVSHRFRMLLERYVKALYPATDFLPIGNGFVDFPWVIFKSYDLAQIRRGLFRANYFLNSRSLNLLNLILFRG